MRLKNCRTTFGLDLHAKDRINGCFWQKFNLFCGWIFSFAVVNVSSLLKFTIFVHLLSYYYWIVLQRSADTSFVPKSYQPHLLSSAFYVHYSHHSCDRMSLSSLKRTWLHHSIKVLPTTFVKCLAVNSCSTFTPKCAINLTHSRVNNKQVLYLQEQSWMHCSSSKSSIVGSPCAASHPIMR